MYGEVLAHPVAAPSPNNKERKAPVRSLLLEELRQDLERRDLVWSERRDVVGLMADPAYAYAAPGAHTSETGCEEDTRTSFSFGIWQTPRNQFDVV